MAFSNPWDNTTPSDFELANLYAGNLRQWRLDVQERMGAMSGLDAAKPAFASDAQPASWNGVLYFATDTGLTYQFQNPNWVNVAVFGGARVFKSQVVQSFTGTTIAQVYNIAIPPIFNANSRVRITAFYQQTAVGSGGTINFTIAGPAAAEVIATPGLFGGTQNMHVVVEGGNYGATNTQYWMWNDIASVAQTSTITSTTVETVNGVDFLMDFVGGTANDFATFYGMGIEIF